MPADPVVHASFIIERSYAAAPPSGSLLTMEFVPEGAGTRLVFTEQGAHLGGEDGSLHREEGSRELTSAAA